MTEVVHTRDGDAVGLRPCPPWCTQTRHFASDAIVFAEDGFHHYGPEIAVPTSDRFLLSHPKTVVKVTLKAWTSQLDAEPDPGHIDLQLATEKYDTDLYVELTPKEAREIAAALLQVAEIAESSAGAPAQSGDRA